MKPTPVYRSAIAWILLLLGQLASAPGMAGSTSTTFGVTATVTGTCSVSAGTHAFGTYTGAQLDTTSTVSVTCTSLSAYTVALDVGTGSGASVTTRKMTGSSSGTLNYSLYQDTTRLVVWGTVAGLADVVGVGSGALQLLTVYGRIPSGQSPAAGSYTDTITVTVAY